MSPINLQPPLFVELVEAAETRDEWFDDPQGWGTKPKPPSGQGWRIADYSHEKRTRWERRRLFPARGRL
jgi:hypothetical protein